MSLHLIGEDCLIGIGVGGTANGTAPGTISTASYKGIARRVTLSSSIEKTNVKALGDANVQNRYHSGAQQVEIEGFVTDAGWVIEDGLSGKYIQVSYSPVNGVDTAWSYAGVVTDWRTEGSVGTEQTERFTLDLNPNHA